MPNEDSLYPKDFEKINRLAQGAASEDLIPATTAEALLSQTEAQMANRDKAAVEELGDSINDNMCVTSLYPVISKV